MKIYIISVESYNEDRSSYTSIAKIVTNEEVAKSYCSERNNSRKSSYSCYYDYDEYEVEE